MYLQKPVLQINYFNVLSVTLLLTTNPAFFQFPLQFSFERFPRHLLQILYSFFPPRPRLILLVIRARQLRVFLSNLRKPTSNFNVVFLVLIFMCCVHLQFISKYEENYVHEISFQFRLIICSFRKVYQLSKLQCGHQKLKNIASVLFFSSQYFCSALYCNCESLDAWIDVYLSLITTKLYRICHRDRCIHT